MVKNFLKAKKKNTNLLVIFLFILIIVYKSLSMPFTFDEAYTFLNYVITRNYFNIGLANNHLLNTILMGFFSYFGFDVFILRLPNIIAGVIFVITAFKLSQKYSDSYFSLTILLCNILTIDFFSHARGYGITSSLNFLAFYIFLHSKFKYKYQLSLFLIYLGSLSIFINLLNLYIFIFLSYLHNKKFTKNLKIHISNFIFIVLSWPILNWIFEVTKDDRPVFGNEIEFNFLNSLISIFGFIDTYYFSYFFIKLLFFVLVMFVLFKKKIQFNFINNFFFLVLIALVILPLLFSRPFPTGRILIPFIPIFQIFIIELFKNFPKKSFKKFLTLIIIFNFLTALNLSSSIQWGVSVDLSKSGLAEICDNPNFLRPEIEYYINYLNVCGN